MSQINLHVDASFLKELAQYMRHKGVSQKSKAIRLAIHEALVQLSQKPNHVSYKGWVGLGLNAPVVKKPKFKSEDELW